MLKNRNRTEKGLVNRLMNKGLVFSTLVMLFVVTTSIGMVVGAEDKGTYIITLDNGYPLGLPGIPSLSPDWEKIAFPTYEELGNGSTKLTLWVTNMDGSNMKKLDERIDDQSSDMINFDMIAGWSPDGKNILNWKVSWIFGEMGVELAVGELWIINSDGTDKKRLVEGATPSDVIWSPDGAKITYTETISTTKFSDSASHTETTGEFYVVDINGNSSTLIADGVPLLWISGEEIIYYKKEFTWKEDVHHTIWKIDLDRAIATKLGSINNTPYCISPDASKIAYRDHGIWVVNIDGSNLKQLSFSDGDYHLAQIWSPDGKRIAFLSWEEGIQRGIWVINSDGSDQKKLSSVIPTSSWGLWGQVWNKDSSKIAYANHDWENLTYDIYILDAGKPPSTKLPTGETPQKEAPEFKTTSTPEVPIKGDKGIHGFEAIFAIVGLLAVTYLFKRRK